MVVGAGRNARFLQGSERPAVGGHFSWSDQLPGVLPEAPEQKGVTSCCVHPLGLGSQAEGFPGKCSAVFVRVSVASVVLWVYPQSQCYRALQKPPLLSLCAASEHLGPDVFSKTSTCEIKGFFL